MSAKIFGEHYPLVTDRFVMARLGLLRVENLFLALLVGRLTRRFKKKSSAQFLPNVINCLRHPTVSDLFLTLCR